MKIEYIPEVDDEILNMYDDQVFKINKIDGSFPYERIFFTISGKGIPWYFFRQELTWNTDKNQWLVSYDYMGKKFS